MNNKKQWISEKSAGAILTYKTVVAESLATIGTPYFARRHAVGTITAAILCVELSTNFHFLPSKVFPVRCLQLLFKYGKFLYSIGAHICRAQKFFSAPIRGTNSVRYIFQTVSLLIRLRANVGQVTFTAIREIFIFVYQSIQNNLILLFFLPCLMPEPRTKNRFSLLLKNQAVFEAFFSPYDRQGTTEKILGFLWLSLSTLASLLNLN